MNAILTFRFPLKPSVDKSAIRELVTQWVTESQYYDFEEPFLFSEELESFFRSDYNGNQASLKHCEYYDIDTHTDYLAFRINNTDMSNRLWRADAIYSESESLKKKYLTVQLARSMQDIDKRSDCSAPVKYPTIVRLIYEADMVDTDSDFNLPANEIITVEDMDDINASLLTTIFHGGYQTELPSIERYRTELPFIYIYKEGFAADPDSPLSQLAAKFALVSHTYTSSSVQGNLRWNALTGDQDTHPRLVVWHPFIQVKNQLPFTDNIDDSQLYRYLILMLQSCQQCLHLDSLDWDDIYRYQNAFGTGAVASCYVRMNQQIANRMQLQRKKMKLTQGDLADLVGTSKMLISRLERLQTIKVKRELILSIEKALSMNPGELISAEASPMNGTTTTDHQTDQRSIRPRYCRICGTALTSDSVFCHMCGTKILPE